MNHHFDVPDELSLLLNMIF